MRKILLLIFTVGSLIILNANSTQVEKTLDGYIAAWNAHNVKKIETFYADNVRWYDLGYDYTTQGKAAVGKAITDAFMGNVDDMYWGKSGDLFVSGDTVIYEWVYGGTFNGLFDGVTVKNRKFEIKGISTTTINDEGKITSQKDYYDLSGFKKQLGLLP